MNLKEWVRNFKEGEFDNPDIETQIKAGWYDWFCGDDELIYGTKEMGEIISQIVNSDKFDAEKVKVVFKNNCPIVGDLYDDFRICDIEEGINIYVIDINSPREWYGGYKYCVFGEGTFNNPIYKTDDVEGLIKFFVGEIKEKREEDKEMKTETLGSKLKKISAEKKEESINKEVQEVFDELIEECVTIAKEGHSNVVINQSPLYGKIMKNQDKLKEILKTEEMELRFVQGGGGYWDTDDFIISW